MSINQQTLSYSLNEQPSLHGGHYCCIQLKFVICFYFIFYLFQANLTGTMHIDKHKRKCTRINQRAILHLLSLDLMLRGHSLKK